MLKKTIAVLDFGSSQISCIIASKGNNGILNVKGQSSVEYAGFMNSKFIDPEKLEMAIAMAIANTESLAHFKVGEVYVGVPSEFCCVRCRECNINLNKKRKVKDLDVKNLINSGNIFKKNPTHSVINCSPVFFEIDNNRKLIDPRGTIGRSLSGLVSYVLVENNFIDMIDEVLLKIGIKKVEYISSSLAEALFLFTPDIRDKYAILVDVGHLTTSVMLVRGDGLLSLNSFSMGGGQITSDLFQCLKIKYSQAEMLKHKVVLSLDAGDNDIYEISGKDYILPFPAKTTNQIVKDRIDLIAKMINKCFASFEFEFPLDIPVFLTGGGLSYIKGAKDYLGGCLGRKVVNIAPAIPGYNRPHLSSMFGVTDLVITRKDTPVGIFVD